MGGLEACLRQLHGEDHQGIMIQDVRQVTFATLPSSDGFIGTSPCGDFSVLGANDKIGLEGERGGLFQQQLEFIRHLARRRERPLKWIFLETCCGFLVRRKGVRSSDVAHEWWSVNMPGWAPLTIWVQNLRDASSSASRGRCFVTSYSKQFLEVIGNALPQQPQKHCPTNLMDFLDDCSQEVDLEKLGKVQRLNVKAWNEMFNDEKRIPPWSELGVVDLSRRPTGKFGAYISEDFAPIFTTKNDKLLIMKKADASSAKTAGHGRVLTIKERAAMQGYLTTAFPNMSERQVVMALGETLPVNLAGVMLEPVMKAWATYESRLIESGLWGERHLGPASRLHLQEKRAGSKRPVPPPQSPQKKARKIF